MYIPMRLVHYRGCLFMFSATTFFLFLQTHRTFSLAQNVGIQTNVTKNLHFSQFHSNSVQEIKLLGSSRISEDSIQIPDGASLLPTSYDKAGRALYCSPIRFLDPTTKTPSCFETTFSFQFSTGNNGLAFIVVPDEFTIGRPGPWLGIFSDACEHYKVFAVEFDGVNDPGFGDPNDNHVGINIGTIVSFKTVDLLKSNMSLHSGSVHRAWITYSGRRKWIDIYFGSGNKPKPIKPILSEPLDLSPFLQEYMFVGFSASATRNDVVSTHKVLSWNFSSSSQAFLRTPSKRTCQRNLGRQVSKYSSRSSAGGNYSGPPSSFTIFVSFIGLCALAFLCLYWNRSNSRESDNNGNNRNDHVNNVTDFLILLGSERKRPIPPSRARRYSIVEILAATKRFSRIEVLGSGRNGVMYRGTLCNGSYVSIKRFYKHSVNLSGLDVARVLKKIDGSNKQVDHPNLAMIRGWCCDDRETIVVYDYFRNATLDRWLFGNGFGVLPWSMRIRVIKDIAWVLRFLHSKGFVHGNVKTSSVFLDANHRAVLGDYGFEFFLGESGQIESDVFDFGMLVLEIVAGRKSENEADEASGGLLGLAWKMHEEGGNAIAEEERAGSRVKSEEASRVLKIGLICTFSETENGGRRMPRPCMDEVVLWLNNQKAIPELPLSQPSELKPNHDQCKMSISTRPCSKISTE